MKNTILTFLSALLLFLPSSSSANECLGNFDYDNNVDGADAAIFKQHFGRNSYSNPCPPDGPAPALKTGQTTCFDAAGTVIDCTGTGQDGENTMGVEIPAGKTRFTDNNDGTVTDNLTGLLWLKDANCFGSRTWTQALSDCNTIATASCGLTDGSSAGDWRLPNILELITLMDFGSSDPGIHLQSTFNNVSIIFDYWSSTTYTIDPTYAWVGDGAWEKSSNSLVWPVRNPQ